MKTLEVKTERGGKTQPPLIKGDLGGCYPSAKIESFSVLIFVLNTIWNGVQNIDFSSTHPRPLPRGE